MQRILAILMLIFLLCACAPKTTVILVPDDDGTVGQVQVKGTTGEQNLTAVNEYTQVTDSPAAPKIMTQADIDRNFGRSLAAMPASPQSFLFYFATGATEPDADSLAQLGDVLKAIRARTLPNVMIIGHSDRMGDPAHNQKLSMARAAVIERILAAQGVDPSIMSLSGHGENDPIVPTDPGVAEPRNRRVEVFLR